jgi:beta-galactosidase GanA
VDNEVGGFNDCYCDRCLASFQDYLRQKYGTIENLNRSWGAHFWSFNFSDFNEVPRPGTPFGRDNPQLALEYRRFLSHLNVEFPARAQDDPVIQPGQVRHRNFGQPGHTPITCQSETIDLRG